MQLALTMAQNAGWLAALAGLLLLAWRAGRYAGGALVASMAAIAIWAIWGEPIVRWLDVFLFGTPPPVPAATDSSNAAAVLAAMGYTHRIGRVCESLLILGLGLSFLFAVMSVKRSGAPPDRPTPDPLHGSDTR